MEYVRESVIVFYLHLKEKWKNNTLLYSKHRKNARSLDEWATLNALVMSALDSQAPCPSKQMSMMVWLMVAYCMEKSALGVTLLMLGKYEPCGEDRSIIRVATPIGLMRIIRKKSVCRCGQILRVLP